MSVHETRSRLDHRALEILNAEYDHNEFIGGRLLSVARYCRNGGINDDVLIQDVIMSSVLWTSYEGSTSQPARKQQKILSDVIGKSKVDRPFDLSDALETLYRRVATATWVGRNGSRDRAILLAFIWFCWEHNCFTRTLSTYELAKYTNGISPKSVGRALASLIKIDRGPLREVPRRDISPGRRSANQYQLRLDWNKGHERPNESSGKELIGSLTHENTGDLWTRRALGETAHRVWQAISACPERYLSAADIAASAGMSRDMAKRGLEKLYAEGLAIRRSGGASGRGRPPWVYQAVDADLGALAEVLGVSGLVAAKTDAIAERQKLNDDFLASRHKERGAADDKIIDLAEKRKGIVYKLEQSVRLAQPHGEDAVTTEPYDPDAPFGSVPEFDPLAEEDVS